MSAVSVLTKPARARAAVVAGQRPAGIGGWAILLILALFAVGPLIIFVFAAFKTQAEIVENPFGLPADLLWSNFSQAWQQAHMGRGLTNSLVLVAGAVAGTLVIAGLAAYAMARLDLPGGGSVILYLLVSSALPMQMFLVPLFFIWTRTGLYDTKLGLIIIYCATLTPFATLLLRAFLLTLPRELEEAARIDGAGELRIAARVILPNALPGILTVALITALATYNEFLFAVTFLESDEQMPVSTSFFAFQQSYVQNTALTAAAGLIMLVPMLAIFLVLQRRFVEGMANTGMAA
ncbi:carbohydrate ABC transporter permease [Asanoa iriomotensis]|uniref:Sugar ABC transporter permease n=1 Tax=Asanoa iriomotensis TaxID=234613 RepID=A0ABQ4C0Y8_9ACTN|nr:carbohydrate ABC transporter permease [Asanoa iriomotensis]GIF56096.1 sugar ABC transporter permease [Asanoa iriomotensis]